MDLTDIIVVALVGGLISLDTTAAWQTMFSQPIVACSFVGYLLGDIQTGLLVGTLTQLLWVGIVPAGGVIFPDSNLGSYISAAFAVELNRFYPESIGWILVSSIILGIGVGFIGEWEIAWLRRRNTQLIHKADKVVDSGNYGKIILLHWTGILRAWIEGALLTGIAFTGGLWLLKRMFQYVNISSDGSFAPEMAVLLGISCAVLYSVLKKQGQNWLLISGLLMGALLFYGGWF